MTGNVIHRGKGSFAFVESTIFFDHGLSAKAKGIYCQIRSLENNPEWVFTVKGFASLVRDGADAVSAGIKELESSGYIIRARKRSENGRFLKADGYAILSEFTREPPANVEFEPQEKPIDPENAQLCARTGKPVSGKATSGEPAPINYSSDKPLNLIKSPPLAPPTKAPKVPVAERHIGDVVALISQLADDCALLAVLPVQMHLVKLFV